MCSNSSLLTSDTSPSYQDHFTGTFVGNFADHRSALTARDGSKFSFQNTYFSGNGANGTLISDDGELIVLDSDVVEETELQISFSTFAANQVETVLFVGENSSMDLTNSIIYEKSDANRVLFDLEQSANTSCNIYHEGDSVVIIPGDTSVVTDNPGFVDAANGDYHLRPDSVAIDRCVLGLIDTVYPDQDLDERPIDIHNVDNGFGNYDAGADEFPDIIFINGFEEVI